jgi:hypothetical protein
MRRLPAQRIRRCGLNATSQTRLRRCGGDWWQLSPQCYRVAHAARLQPQLGTDIEICDTVRLGVCRFNLPLAHISDRAPSFLVASCDPLKAEWRRPLSERSAGACSSRTGCPSALGTFCMAAMLMSALSPATFCILSFPFITKRFKDLTGDEVSDG